MIRIETLAENQTLIPIVANSWIREFNYLHPTRTKAQVLEKLQQHINTNKLPICYVLFKENKFIGTASLRPLDISSYTHVSPWLGAVIIEPEFRNQGLGTYFVQEVMDRAKRLHKDIWYLWTPDRETFYAKMGWKKIDEVDYNQTHGTVMQLNLTEKSNHEK